MRGLERQLIRVDADPHNPLDPTVWPGNIAGVRDLLTWGDFAQATVFVGENGAGKSTIVEGIAKAWGFPLHGGEKNHQREAQYDDAHLADHLRVVRGVAAGGGFFLRAETMHGFSEYLTDRGSTRGDRLQQRSHGEGFLDLLTEAAREPGLWILDEPESALSFQGQLHLMALLQERLVGGSQVMISTHSPMIASLPGADLVEVTERGLSLTSFDDLEVVQHWRRFLAGPQRYLQHLG